MSFNLWRRRANTIDRGAPRVRLGGESPRPNVLTGQATPNRLGGTSAAGRSGRSAMPAASTARPIGRSADQPATRRRGPSALSTAVFVAFVLITIARGLATFFEDGGEPQPTTAGRSFGLADAGFVLFGRDLGSECEIAFTDVLFEVGSSVYWTATLRDQIGPDESVGWWLQHDGRAVDRHTEQFPDDPEPWDILCGGPLALEGGGLYRLEIWNDRHTEQLSSGDFVLVLP